MNSVLQRVYEIGIIPVIAFNSVDEALPLCKALMAGGLPAAEVTFRTACAEDCIKKIHEELPEMLLGAGTVLTKDQADRAMAAGASFIVATGFDPEVCQHVIDKGGIMMPGTATAGEMQQAMNMGCEVVKFFPAEANGGVDKLKNIGAARRHAGGQQCRTGQRHADAQRLVGILQTGRLRRRPPRGQVGQRKRRQPRDVPKPDRPGSGKAGVGLGPEQQVGQMQPRHDQAQDQHHSGVGMFIFHGVPLS